MIFEDQKGWTVFTGKFRAEVHVSDAIKHAKFDVLTVSMRCYEVKVHRFEFVAVGTGIFVEIYNPCFFTAAD